MYIKTVPWQYISWFYFLVYRRFDIRISFPIKSSHPCLIVFAHGQSVYIFVVSFKRVLRKSWLFPWAALRLMLFNSGRQYFPLPLQTIPRQQVQLSDNRCAAYIDHNKYYRRFRKAYSQSSPDIVAFLIWPTSVRQSGPRLNIKTIFPGYGDSHVKDKTILRPSYL